MSGDFPGPSAKEIAALLRSHAEALGWMLFPAARRSGGMLCIGSLHGEPGVSLKIMLQGSKAGTWVDYATSEADPRGKGDMLKLLQLTVGGGDLKRGIEEAKRFLRLDTMDPRALERMQQRAKRAREKSAAEHASEVDRKRRNAHGLWQSAAPLTPSSPVVRYLAGRGIIFGENSPLPRPPGSIRYHHQVWNDEQRRKLPAMVTAFTALSGDFAAAHITYLVYREGKGWDRLREKADDVERAKIIRSPAYWGAHIPLWKGAQRCKLGAIAMGTEVQASEGIEDGLSYAMANPQARIVAAGSLGNLGEMQLPPHSGRFTLLAQNDEKPEPIAALEAAVRKQQEQARRHAGERGTPRIVALRRPPAGVKDWNDWLNLPTDDGAGA